MYFKQLELTGFKSFADRTTLRLEPGITSVVGPNGCGKSNILDALRWALGEQRARELRGNQMQDIIFNGSEDRQPMGMAEVSVTFDNADSKLPVDFGEVQVTRRVYRSGESEYLINKAQCRLKDIQELFMDTGIGTQAYSLVGQGKMDLILSSKPEDRRFLFEEAAGIIKYKNRKRVAMRRLDSAEQNLLRLSDIIAEVQRQMRSLKRQVNAAIRYRELSEQLRELEIRAAWLKHVALTEQIASLRTRFGEAQDAYEQVSTRITKLEARREELGLAQLETDRVLMARREGVHEIDSEMERIERDIALLRQQCEFSKEQQAQAAREREGFLQRAEASQARVQETEQRVEATRAEAVSCAEAFEQKTREHGEASQRVIEADAHLETIRARVAEQVSHRTKTLTEIETLGTNIDEADRQVAAVCERLDAVSARREELAGRLDAIRVDEAQRQAELDEADARYAQAGADQAAQGDELRAVEEQWRAVREKKSSLDARLVSLRELRDTYEGFAVGVRAVMRAKNEGAPEAKDIVGPVGDLLSADKEYERAIEAALGGNINNVVVENADAAKAAIGFLKAHSAGRVTFLPLDIIRGARRDHDDALTGTPGVVGPAIEFVEYDARLQSAVEYLLHGTVVVETLDDAIRIARERSSFPRLVTLDGEVVSSAGAVTGGRMRHESRGLLGRSAEIAELERQVADADGEIDALAERRNALTESLRVLNEQIKELQQQQGGLRGQLNEIGLALARHTTELDSLTQSSQALAEQREALSQQRQALEQKRNEALARADSMESDDEALQREMAEAQAAASSAREALSVRAGELADLRVHQASLNQQAEETARDKQREQRDREEALAEAERRERAQAQLLEEQAGLENKIALAVERSKALSESKEEARAKVVEADNQRKALLEESEAIDGQLRDLRNQARETQSAVHQLELDLRQSEDRIGFFQERILTEYNLALGSLKADEVGSDELDEGERDGMVTDLRQRIQRMGEVNLMAIEEYEALEERNEFLVGQANDLQQARADLLGVIERSDKKIREMFMDTFRKVEENFHTFFRRLFNGGQARIYLLDEDDPLESGIEIEARPPGKKLQSISLLSGGESAMTAIALLFSIFKAKPSPFCILDEVDAPLDDANIGRFLALLDEFTHESQFIIITHNKQTMAKAQALYGVTMQERGVSQLVSVRFEDVRDTDAA
ncbi:MAG: chromosome segregation protein SMC [Candidatus Hydrogenedentes bacterium]|nr:chromosome segregation protein SMC [Candidatus Hydrogenedentota bacterium]